MGYINPAPLQKEGFDTPETKKLYSMILKYLQFPCAHFYEWDKKPNCGYVFTGAQWYGADQNNTAFVLALAAKFGAYDETIAGISRKDLKEMAIKILRYSCFTHDTGPADCVRVDGRNKYQANTKWGGEVTTTQAPKDRYFQGVQVGRSLSSFGFAAWFLWEDLNEETRQMAFNVITSYAEKWSKVEPREGTYYDTQAEENGWGALGIYTAAAMFRDDPRAKGWRDSAINWMLDMAVTPMDMVSGKKIEDGSSLRRHIDHITIHPDYTTENHAVVHPGYLNAPTIFRSVMHLFSMLSGAEELPGLRHNWNNIYKNVFKILASEDGNFIPVQSQDWWYFLTYENLCTHAASNVLFLDPEAAYMEQNTIDTLAKAQAGHQYGTFLNNDPENCIITDSQRLSDWEDAVSSCISYVYLLHFCCGSGASPATKEQYEESADEVRNYPFGSTAVQRLADSMAVFSYRNSAQAMVFPEDKLWTITAPPCSTFGEMRFAGGCPEDEGLSNQGIIRTTKNAKIYDESNLAARTTILRGLGKIQQDAAMVVLPGGNTVIFQRVKALEDCEIKQFSNGLVGIRNDCFKNFPEHAPGYRMLSINDAPAIRMDGYDDGSEDVIHDFKAVTSAAIDKKIAYLLHGSNGVRYVSHHKYPKWKGIEDFLVLNCYEGLSLHAGDTLPKFIMVCLPNKGIADANTLKQKFYVSDEGNTDAVILGNTLAYSVINSSNETICASFTLNSKEVPLFEGQNSFKDGVNTWMASGNSKVCGYRSAVQTVAGDRNFDAVVLPDQTVLIRFDGESAYHTV